MSGGAYNYLCFKDPAEIAAAHEVFREMANRLAEICPDSSAARDTTAMAVRLETLIHDINELGCRAREVWRAVEWRASGDYGDDQVREAVAAYADEIITCAQCRGTGCGGFGDDDGCGSCGGTGKQRRG